VENQSASGRGVFSLVHEVVEDIPLKKRTAVQALFVRSRIWQRPISLKTILVEQDRAIPIRIEVEPSGGVQVFRKNEVLDRQSTSLLQKFLDQYVEELEGSSHEDLEEVQKKKFSKLVAAIADRAVSASMNLVSHAPSSATAILRYYEMIERRVYSAMKKAIQGKQPLKKTATGARIQVLPSIPEFELDPQSQARTSFRLQSEDPPQLSVARDLFEVIHRSQRLQHVLSENIGTLSSVSGESNPKKGDRFWGDPESGSKEAEAEGEEEDGSLDPGASPNPNEVEVPFEWIGEFLKEEIELPHLRPKAGLSLITQREKDSAQHRPHGDILWHRMNEVLLLGRESLKRQGLDPDRMSRSRIFKEGMKYIHPGDWIVPSTQNVPQPEVNAVIVIWMDMTGSMLGKPIEMAKQFIFNFKALLSTRYKHLTFRYVGFSDRAIEFPSEAKFFQSFLNGGTDYSTGIEKTKEILNEYPSHQWDKYSFGIGDAEDGNPQVSLTSLQELVQETQFTGFIRTETGSNRPDAQFIQGIEQLVIEDHFFGYGVLEASQGLEQGIQVLRQIFGN
jgi:hypothetical protein